MKHPRGYYLRKAQARLSRLSHHTECDRGFYCKTCRTIDNLKHMVNRWSEPKVQDSTLKEPNQKSGSMGDAK